VALREAIVQPLCASLRRLTQSRWLLVLTSLVIGHLVPECQNPFNGYDLVCALPLKAATTNIAIFVPRFRDVVAGLTYEVRSGSDFVRVRGNQFAIVPVEFSGGAERFRLVTPPGGEIAGVALADSPNEIRILYDLMTDETWPRCAPLERAENCRQRASRMLDRLSAATGLQRLVLAGP
jgi:hypothetical protein